jgi:hypothetical protein
MRNSQLIILSASLAFTGCSRSSGNGATVQKVSGPEIHSLSHDHLMAIYRDCHQFGPIEDPRVKYTVAYCVNVDTAQSGEGWAAPNAAKVDPEINKLH